MDRIKEYTADSRQMLEDWRKEGRTPQEFLADVRKHSRYEEICWRGTSLNSLSKYSPVLSTSSMLHVAYDFCSNKPEAAIVAFVGYEGYYVAPSSVHQNEEEVILVLTERFNCYQVGWLRGIPVYLSCSSQNLSFWEKEVKFQIGLQAAINLVYAAAKLNACRLIGFCPIGIEEDFYFGCYRLSIYVKGSPENFTVFINKPESGFPETLLVVKEDSLEVLEDFPELGFRKAVTLEQELYGDTLYTYRRVVQKDYPELGFWKAVPVICYQVKDKLWVTGPLPTK